MILDLSKTESHFLLRVLCNSSTV